VGRGDPALKGINFHDSSPCSARVFSRLLFVGTCVAKDKACPTRTRKSLSYLLRKLLSAGFIPQGGSDAVIVLIKFRGEWSDDKDLRSVDSVQRAWSLVSSN